MAGLSGLNLVYEAAGMHASLLGFCLESLILSDDIIGQALRCVRGIEVNDETLALDQMAQVCMGGPGHYLGTKRRSSRNALQPVLRLNWTRNCAKHIKSIYPVRFQTRPRLPDFRKMGAY